MSKRALPEGVKSVRFRACAAPRYLARWDAIAAAESQRSGRPPSRSRAIRADADAADRMSADVRRAAGLLRTMIAAGTAPLAELARIATCLEKAVGAQPETRNQKPE